MERKFNRVLLQHYEANNVVNPRVITTTALNFGIDRVLLINNSGQRLQPNGPVEVHPEVHLALDAKDPNGKLYKDYHKVYLKPKESIPGSDKYIGYSKDKYDFTYLKDFLHPEEDTIYLIGADQSVFPIDMMDLSEGNSLVTMEITRNSLWSIVASGIVTRDAFLQDKYGKFIE